MAEMRSSIGRKTSNRKCRASAPAYTWHDIKTSYALG